MKTGTWILVGIVLATAVYQIIARVPAETLSIALGVACGVGASIPVTVGLLIALLRQRQPTENFVEPREEESVRVQPQYVPQRIAAPQLPQPQIIVLTPQGQFVPGQFSANAQIPWFHQPYPMPVENDQAIDARDWRIIGEE